VPHRTTPPADLQACKLCQTRAANGGKTFAARRPRPYVPAMRTAELLLLSLPVILLAAWFIGLRHASMRAFMAAALLLAALGATLLWFGQQRAFTGRYVPTRLQDSQHDKVVP